jgi:hypothetical protein
VELVVGDIPFVGAVPHGHLLRRNRHYNSSASEEVMTNWGITGGNGGNGCRGEYGYFGPAGGSAGEPCEREIDPQGEINDIVDSARDLKRVIDRQEEQIKALHRQIGDFAAMNGLLSRDIDQLRAENKEKLELLASRLVKIDVLASENCKLHAQLKDAMYAKLRREQVAPPDEAIRQQADSWCKVWEQIYHPHIPMMSHPNSGEGRALLAIRRWQEMERKLKEIARD